MYEEDLQSNPFLTSLQNSSKLKPLYESAFKSSNSNSIICVPKISSLPSVRQFSRPDFAEHHILFPSFFEYPGVPNAEDGNECCIFTQGERFIYIESGEVLLLHVYACAPPPFTSTGAAPTAFSRYLFETVGEPRISTRVLFEETCYDDNFRSVKLLCLDGALLVDASQAKRSHSSTNDTTHRSGILSLFRRRPSVAEADAPVIGGLFEAQNARVSYTHYVPSSSSLPSTITAQHSGALQQGFLHASEATTPASRGEGGYASLSVPTSPATDTARYTHTPRSLTVPATSSLPSSPIAASSPTSFSPTSPTNTHPNASVYPAAVSSPAPQRTQPLPPMPPMHLSLLSAAYLATPPPLASVATHPLTTPTAALPQLAALLAQQQHPWPPTLTKHLNERLFHALPERRSADEQREFITYLLGARAAREVVFRSHALLYFISEFSMLQPADADEGAITQRAADVHAAAATLFTDCMAALNSFTAGRTRQASAAILATPRLQRDLHVALHSHVFAAVREEAMHLLAGVCGREQAALARQCAQLQGLTPADLELDTEWTRLLAVRLPAGYAPPSLLLGPDGTDLALVYEEVRRRAVAALLGEDPAKGRFQPFQGLPEWVAAGVQVRGEAVRRAWDDVEAEGDLDGLERWVGGEAGEEGLARHAGRLDALVVSGYVDAVDSAAAPDVVDVPPPALARRDSFGQLVVPPASRQAALRWRVPADGDGYGDEQLYRAAGPEYYRAGQSHGAELVYSRYYYVHARPHGPARELGADSTASATSAGSGSTWANGVSRRGWVGSEASSSGSSSDSEDAEGRSSRPSVRCLGFLGQHGVDADGLYAVGRSGRVRLNGTVRQCWRCRRYVRGRCRACTGDGADVAQEDASRRVERRFTSLFSARAGALFGSDSDEDASNSDDMAERWGRARKGVFARRRAAELLARGRGRRSEEDGEEEGGEEALPALNVRGRTRALPACFDDSDDTTDDSEGAGDVKSGTGTRSSAGVSMGMGTETEVVADATASPRASHTHARTASDNLRLGMGVGVVGRGSVSVAGARTRVIAAGAHPLELLHPLGCTGDESSDEEKDKEIDGTHTDGVHAAPVHSPRVMSPPARPDTVDAGDVQLLAGPNSAAALREGSTGPRSPAAACSPTHPQAFHDAATLSSPTAQAQARVHQLKGPSMAVVRYAPPFGFAAMQRLCELDEDAAQTPLELACFFHEVYVLVQQDAMARWRYREDRAKVREARRKLLTERTYAETHVGADELKAYTGRAANGSSPTAATASVDVRIGAAAGEDADRSGDGAGVCPLRVEDMSTSEAVEAENLEKEDEDWEMAEVEEEVEVEVEVDDETAAGGAMQFARDSDGDDSEGESARVRRGVAPDELDLAAYAAPLGQPTPSARATKRVRVKVKVPRRVARPRAVTRPRGSALSEGSAGRGDSDACSPTSIAGDTASSVTNTHISTSTSASTSTAHAVEDSVAVLTPTRMAAHVRARARAAAQGQVEAEAASLAEKAKERLRAVFGAREDAAPEDVEREMLTLREGDAGDAEEQQEAARRLLLSAAYAHDSELDASVSAMEEEEEEKETLTVADTRASEPPSPSPSASAPQPPSSARPSAQQPRATTLLLTADDMLPLLVYVLVHAQHLHRYGLARLRAGQSQAAAHVHACVAAQPHLLFAPLPHCHAHLCAAATPPLSMAVDAPPAQRPPPFLTALLALATYFAPPSNLLASRVSACMLSVAHFVAAVRFITSPESKLKPPPALAASQRGRALLAALLLPDTASDGKDASQWDSKHPSASAARLVVSGASASVSGGVGGVGSTPAECVDLSDLFDGDGAPSPTTASAAARLSCGSAGRAPRDDGYTGDLYCDIASDKLDLSDLSLAFDDALSRRSSANSPPLRSDPPPAELSGASAAAPTRSLALSASMREGAPLTVTVDADVLVTRSRTRATASATALGVGASCRDSGSDVAPVPSKAAATPAPAPASTVGPRAPVSSSDAHSNTIVPQPHPRSSPSSPATASPWPHAHTRACSSVEPLATIRAVPQERLRPDEVDPLTALFAMRGDSDDE